jgi:hypothetical protein
MEDGRIWWLRKDAIRLGAGFLPMRDDQALKTELRAPNQRALVNERTLIGAFGNDRYSIERPMTFERDGFRYVDAEGFLTWLSQYISLTQAVEIAFPNELARKVREAKAKTAALRPPVASQEFESLTLALDGWFDKKLDDLPNTLRQRVERDFFPLPWDGLSAEQRRSRALQWDYRHDPATELERQYWWDFFKRLHDLQVQREQWQSATTPTASDLAVKESRLKELQQEIDSMELEKQQVRNDYYPGRKSFDADKKGFEPTTDYIPYPKAMNILRKKWQAIPDELAMWIFLGQENGGIAAYMNANELNRPREFYFAYFEGVEDYLAPLMSCWFLQDDIDQFEPADRYITGAELIERWGRHHGIHPEAFIRAKIAESRLLDCHPTFGGTIVSFDDHENFPPLSAGLFSVSQIELIEAEDGLGSSPTQPRADTVRRHNTPGGKGGRPKEPLAEAVERAYIHFRDKGDLTILQPGNIRSFLKSFKSLANDEPPSLSFGNGNISAYIAERIKEVKIPREGECSVKTQDRTEGRKINPGQGYSQKSIAKLLANLRKKYPLPS